MALKLKFNTKVKSEFFATVRSRVDTYFTDSGKSRHADDFMWLKTFVFLSGFVTLYALIISNAFSAATMLPMVMMLGAFSAFVGFNICHDAIHGALSQNKTANTFFGWIFNLLGASPYVWSITHNVVHHTYTNIPGHDDDIDVAAGMIRVSEDMPLHKKHRFQHLYAFHLYSLASLSWAFRKDYKKFFQPKMGQTETIHPRREYYSLFLSKALYYALFIVLPFVVLDITWWQFMIGFFALHLAQGLTMGLVFQLAHVVEGTDFPLPNEAGNIEEAWAEHQMRTTANFASDCPVAAFLLGGLNRQIEHHLFPKVCHIHYRAIGKIVKQTAAEFDLPYHENATLFTALRSHYRILKRFGPEASAA